MTGLVVRFLDKEQGNFCIQCKSQMQLWRVLVLRASASVVLLQNGDSRNCVMRHSSSCLPFHVTSFLVRGLVGTSYGSVLLCLCFTFYCIFCGNTWSRLRMIIISTPRVDALPGYLNILLKIYTFTFKTSIFQSNYSRMINLQISE